MRFWCTAILACCNCHRSISGRCFLTVKVMIRYAAGLDQQGVSLADAVFVQLYLADMGSFAAANTAYSRHFPAVSPAARACIQTPLPEGVPLAVDVLFRPGLPKSTFNRSCLRACSTDDAWGYTLHTQACCVYPSRMRTLQARQPGHASRCFFLRVHFLLWMCRSIEVRIFVSFTLVGCSTRANCNRCTILG